MFSFQHIRQRKLVQWGIAYLAGAWVLLQVLQFLAGSFEWPAQLLRVAAVLAAAGFFAVLVLAWYHGEQGRQRVGALEAVLLGAVLILGSGTAWLMRGKPMPAPLILPAERNSIAVLAFDDLSPAGDQAYFSDGITEEILNVLAKTRGLRVAARTSSFSFKGQSVPIEEIARRLRVTHVLEGSVRKAGDRVRITAQLIDAKNGYHVWSETFDRELKDIFAVQDEISNAIANKLALEITGAVPTTKSERAYELYLRGRQAWAVRKPDSLRNAVRYFEQAIAADSNYAPAHAGLAGTLIVLPLYTDAKPAELQSRAQAAANTALSLDSTLVEAWATLAYARFSYDHDWAGAEQAFRRALTINPNYTTANHWYGDYLGGLGRINEALPYYERAARLDPLSAVPRFGLGWTYMSNRRFDEAATNLQQAIALDSTLVDSYTTLARLRVFQGRFDEGIAGLEEAVRRSHRRSTELGFLGYAYGRARREADARRILAELQARRGSGYVSPLHFAFVHIGLGDYDRAFEELEEARKAGDPWLTENNHDLSFEPLRSDRRWARLLRRMGIP